MFGVSDIRHKWCLRVGDTSKRATIEELQVIIQSKMQLRKLTQMETKKFKGTFDIDAEYETLEERHKIIQDRLLKCYAEEVGYIKSSLSTKDCYGCSVNPPSKDAMNV